MTISITVAGITDTLKPEHKKVWFILIFTEHHTVFFPYMIRFISRQLNVFNVLL